MTTYARAVLQPESRRLEVVDMPLPVVGADDALLRVDACGICGTDVEEYEGALRDTIGPREPFIPGHEAVGTIAAIGAQAARRWRVGEGDRVAIEPSIPCGTCQSCLTGQYVFCTNWEHRPMSYGFIPASMSPGLWGGFAEYLYLHPNTVLHRLAPTTDPTVAATFNALAAGVEWACTVPATKPGDGVLVLGAGQRGLSCVIGARAAGADPVIVTGLSADRHKLELARELGATATVVADDSDVVAQVLRLTGQRLLDVAVDVTPYASQPVLDAMELVRPGGTVVLAGLKGGRPVSGWVSDQAVLKGLRIQGVRAVGYSSYERAIVLIESGRHEVERLVTHTFPLHATAEAVETLAGHRGGSSPINVLVAPQLT